MDNCCVRPFSGNCSNVCYKVNANRKNCTKTRITVSGNAAVQGNITFFLRSGLRFSCPMVSQSFPRYLIFRIKFCSVS